MTALPITYWSDPLCIWAYLAEDKLSHLRERFGARITVSHRVVPVFGSVPARFERGSWSKAGPAGRAETTRAVARRFGHDEVSGEGWHDAPASTWAPSAAAKALSLHQTETGGDADAVGHYLQALRHAFFVHDANIAKRAVQREVAEGLELPWAPIEAYLDDGTALGALWEDHEERVRLGIQGSPTWVFDGGRAMLYGNVAEGVLLSTVEQLVDGMEAGSSKC